MLKLNLKYKTILIMLKKIALLLLIICFSCITSTTDKTTETESKATPLQKRYAQLLDYPVNSNKIPRSIDKDFKKMRTSDTPTWTSGFFAGNLWYIYQLTKDKKYKEKALEWTKIIEPEKLNGNHHDIGFKIYNSFGHAYKQSNNLDYKDIILTSAKTLTSRYNDTIKAIQSWDAKKGQWDYPVIIDNMMNIELLFEATILSKDSLYHNIAVKHTNTTLKNHFRPDHSTYHVVDYNPDGSVKAKKTHQGYSDESVWARGQAWAIYGFTMAYRYTKDNAYLTRAEQTAQFYLNHQKLPEDGIPFWDFDDPEIPEAPKDVSAATIVASAFYELYNYTGRLQYVKYADKVLANLMKPEYLLNPTVKAPFILNRSTGNFNKKSEMDCPIVYADYYFLEALYRQDKTK